MLQLYDDFISSFNTQHTPSVKHTKLQFFLNLHQPPAHISSQQNTKLGPLLAYAKQYVYDCKSLQKRHDFYDFFLLFCFVLITQISFLAVM